MRIPGNYLCEYIYLYSLLLHLWIYICGNLPILSISLFSSHFILASPKIICELFISPWKCVLFGEILSKNSCPIPASNIWESTIGNVDAAWHTVIPWILPSLAIQSVCKGSYIICLHSDQNSNWKQHFCIYFEYGHWCQHKSPRGYEKCSWI